jgi:penicillin-insensitive murein endopeptidase
VIRTAAQDSEVNRIFVNPAIKKALCRGAGAARTWLHNVRPWWNHDYHFHVRIRCPTDNADCEGQTPVPPGEGCGAELDWWFSEEAQRAIREPAPPRREITMQDLPAMCNQVLNAP